MAGRRARGRRGTEAERRNRPVRLQLWRAGIPVYGRSAAQRYWTSPCGDGKEHRGGAGRRSAAIQKRRKQKVESRRESCTFGRRDQVAFIVAASEPFRVADAARRGRAQQYDAGTTRAGPVSPVGGSRRQRRVRRHHRVERRVL